MGVRRLAVLVCLPAVVLTAGACFATRDDVRTLQGDIATLRAEAARADSAHRAQLRTIGQQLSATTDTLRALNAFLARFSGDVSRFQGDLATTMHSFGQQLIAVQEQTGQSQRRVQELRADLESRYTEAQAAATTATPSGTTPAAAAPAGGTQAGPLQLLQIARAQLDRGAAGAARAGYQDFLTQYPTSDYAADALFGVAESYSFENNTSAADSVYAQVVDRYPKSDRAPTALFKRAVPLMKVPGQEAKGRALLQQIVDKYPTSPEAETAKDRLKTLK
jgi:tol-pal system protein YbgF